jgi:hypothetical protein
MAASQGDLDLLGRGPGGQQRPHLVQQGGVVGDFVVGGLRGTTSSPRLRIDSAVVLTSAIAGNLAIDHRGIVVELPGELSAAFALDQTDVDRFSFFGADALWGICHQPKAPALRPRRQRGIVPSGLSTAGLLRPPPARRNPNSANRQPQYKTYCIHYSASAEREPLHLSLCTRG